MLNNSNISSWGFCCRMGRQTLPSSACRQQLTASWHGARWHFHSTIIHLNISIWLFLSLRLSLCLSRSLIYLWCISMFLLFLSCHLHTNLFAAHLICLKWQKMSWICFFFFPFGLCEEIFFLCQSWDVVETSQRINREGSKNGKS